MEKEQMSVGSRGGRVKVDGVDVGGWAGGGNHMGAVFP